MRWSGYRIALAALLVAACSPTQDRVRLGAGHGIGGTVRIRAAEVSAGQGIEWESGRLELPDGSWRAFRVEGLELGGIGFADVEIEGDVYDLERPEQLSGTYVPAVAGLERTPETPITVLRNEAGVLLALQGVGSRVRLGASEEGVRIELED